MRYAIKRILISIPLFLVITWLSFLLIHLAPGDPTDRLVSPNTRSEDIVQLRHNLGLDQPLWRQYIRWIAHISKGDFGTSYISGKPVFEEILSRLPATLLLSVTSLILIICLSMPLAIICARFNGKWIDSSIMTASLVGMSMPSFWVGLLLMIGFSVYLNILPTSGFLSADLITASIWIRSKDIAWHMVLPLLTIMIGSLAGLTRYIRFNILGTLTQSYILAARSRGIPEWRIYWIHAFKNAALPLVTILGLSLPDLIGGSFVIEYLFSWPGMGQFGIQAVFARDYPVILATLVLGSVLIMVGNMIADLSYHWVDPRIRVPR